MNYIQQIEEEIECYLKDSKSNTANYLFIVLNRSAMNIYNLNINSICLHLFNKYKGMQWPKLCVDSSYDLVLFIGKNAF